MAQTPEERAAEKRRRRAALATGAAAAAAAAAGDGEDGGASAIPAAAKRVTAAAAIVAGLVAFLADQRQRTAIWLTEQMRRRGPVTMDDISRVLAEEQVREDAFRTKAIERFNRGLAVVLAIPDTAKRDAALRALNAREERYARQRTEAMAARAFAAIDRVVLRQQSPQGAFWQLDPNVAEHTAGCLLMGGKFWPWAVLDRVHPPRHAGCPCKLRGYGEAVADGLMGPGDVPDVRQAVRRAAAVVMEGALVVEPEDAEALIEAAGGRELMDLRAALLAGELVVDEAALDLHLASPD